MDKCRECGRDIPAGRLAAMPGTTTCVEHSDAVAIDEDTPGVVDGADMDDIRASFVSTAASDRWT